MSSAPVVPLPPRETPGEGALVDLAGRVLGGVVVTCNDQFYADASNLLLPHPAAFDAPRRPPSGSRGLGRGGPTGLGERSSPSWVSFAAHSGPVPPVAGWTLTLM